MSTTAKVKKTIFKGNGEHIPVGTLVEVLSSAGNLYAIRSLDLRYVAWGVSRSYLNFDL